MIKERYVNFEVANLLRDKGFDEPCDNYYDQSSDEPQQLTLDEMYYSYDEFIKAPTQAMACDWVEEKYGIFIQINRDNQYYEGREVIAVTKEDKKRRHISMYYVRVFDKHSVSKTTKHYDNVESTYNEALKYVLTNLI